MVLGFWVLADLDLSMAIDVDFVILGVALMLMLFPGSWGFMGYIAHAVMLLPVGNDQDR